MSDHSNNTDEYPASSEGRRPTSSNRANSYSQHRSEDEDQDNAHTPPSPSAFIWGGSRRTISSPTSYPPGPNSDRRGDISSTSAPNRRTGGNSSSATGAYSSSSTLDYNPQMSQHNARQNAPSPLAQDTRMDHPASSSTGPSPLPAENGRASRPYPPEGRQSKRQRRELDDNVGSAELNTETNKSSPDRQQRAKVTTRSVGSFIAFRPINKASNSQPESAPSESYVQAANNRVSKGVRPNKQSSSRGVPGRKTRANKYAHSGRCTSCGRYLPSKDYSPRYCETCRQRDRKRKQAKRDKGVCVKCTQPAAPGHARCQNHLEYNRKYQKDQYKRSKEEKAKEDAAGTEVAEADTSNSESEGAQDEADGMEFSGGESTDDGEDDSDMDGAAQEQPVSV